MFYLVCSFSYSSAIMRLYLSLMITLLGNYIEEIAGYLIGSRKILPFFLHCFRAQRYMMTSAGMEDHDIWDYANDQ